MSQARIVPEISNGRVPTRKISYFAEPDRTVPKKISNESGVLRQFASNRVITSKYTTLNFLPRFLLEQFRKLANLWFLFVSILELVPSIAISEPGTGTIGVLLFMITLEAIAQLLEDGKRKKADRKANGSITRIYDSVQCEFVQTTWKDIKCGDVVKVYSYETFPADLLCLCSSEGLECYVETKSLDGETNLKLRSAPKITYDIFRKLARVRSNSAESSPRSANSVSSLSSFSPGATGTTPRKSTSLSSNFVFNVADDMISNLIGMCCDAQDPRDPLTSNAIDTFQGKIILSPKIVETMTKKSIYNSRSGSKSGNNNETTFQTEYPINEKNICLRGCTLRNTDFIYGLVVNTGTDTKIMKSATAAPAKQSDMDRSINRLLSIFLILLVLTCCVGTIMNYVWVLDNIWWEEVLFGGGLGKGNGTGATSILAIFGQLFISMAQMIPISLYVTMKMARVFQTYFMTNDENMVHVIPSEYSTDGKETIIKPKIRTVDLNDDIGQISYVSSFVLEMNVTLTNY
jgi:magnesium-transporting ATPase (P-type)